MYEIVNRRGLSAVFPKGFTGEAKDVLAAGFEGVIYSGNGKSLDKGTLEEFCSRLGITPESVRPSKDHHEFLDSLCPTLGIEVKVKSVKPTKGKDRRKVVNVKTSRPKQKARREPTPAELAEREVINRLKDRYTTRSVKSGGRGKAQRTNLIFTMKDRKEKDAEAEYKGRGTFEMPFNREAGTRIMARNKWAARVLTEEYQAIWTELHPPATPAPTEPEV